MIIKKYVEIRPGAGGAESEDLAEEMRRVYIRYCSKNKIEVEDLNTDKRYYTLLLTGEGKKLQVFENEKGVHKFQRVPRTEKRGRVHTSTISVAVLTIDETDNKKKYYKDSDVKIDEFRASGAGGQHVNKTSSAIRVTHKPTGIVVTCQNERSQHRNKATALAILNSKLEAIENEKKTNNIANSRAKQVGTGERNESRRVYNEQREEIVDNILNERKRYKDFFKGELFNDKN